MGKVVKKIGTTVSTGGLNLVPGIGKKVEGAVGGIIDPLTGKPAYDPNEYAFLNPESQGLIDSSKKAAGVATKQAATADKNQLAARKEQLKVAQRLGLISEQQAALETAAIDEQLGLATQQQANIDALTAMATGTGPSLAQNQLQDATDRNIKQIVGQVASNRGVPAGMALRTGVNAIGEANQQMASDSANLRLKEQMDATNALTSALASTRGQSMSTGQNATSNRLAATGAQGDTLGNIRTGDITTGKTASETATKERALASDIAERDRQAQIDKERIQAGQASDARKSQSEMISNLGSAAAAAASDEDLKTDIKDATKDIESFLDALSTKSYKYKKEIKDSPVAGEKEYTSPMAQDFEETKIGKSMVKDTEDGKVVDYAKGAGALFAALSNLHDRMKKMENE